MANVEAPRLPLSLEGGRVETPSQENSFAFFDPIVQSFRAHLRGLGRQIAATFAPRFPAEDILSSELTPEEVVALLPELTGSQLIVILRQRHDEEILDRARRELFRRAESYFKTKIEYERMEFLQSPLSLRFILSPDQVNKNIQSLFKLDWGCRQSCSQPHIFILDLSDGDSTFQRRLFPPE